MHLLFSQTKKNEVKKRNEILLLYLVNHFILKFCILNELISLKVVKSGSRWTNKRIYHLHFLGCV